MYAILGWINIALALILLLPFALLNLTKRNDSKLYGVSRKIKKLHKPLGIVMVIIAIIHGLLALGSFTLHTGTIAGIVILITGSLGIAFMAAKKKRLFKLHKVIAGVFIIVLVIHLIWPSILS